MRRCELDAPAAATFDTIIVTAVLNILGNISLFVLHRIVTLKNLNF